MEFVVDKKFEWQGRITPKVGAVMRMFGVDVDRLAEASARHHCRVEIGAGEICYITGPSGSGKSVLLRELMAAMHKVGATRGRPLSASHEPRATSHEIIDLNAIDLCNDRAVIDCIDGNFIDALRTLSIAGLSDVFAILNTPAHLSEGQKYRFRLAKALASVGATRGRPSANHESRATSPGIIFADEFCSNLDRITAAVIAHQIRKFATRRKVAFILASSREDILADLAPDVIITKKLNGKTEVDYKYVHRNKTS
jgi:ABC-type ATPase with predicted acetyltransferase domain